MTSLNRLRWYKSPLNNLNYIKKRNGLLESAYPPFPHHGINSVKSSRYKFPSEIKIENIHCKPWKNTCSSKSGSVPGVY